MNPKFNIIEVGDYSKSQIKLGDFVKLKKLYPGDILYLDNDGRNNRIVIVGNATASSVVYEADLGWDDMVYNNWTILKHYRINHDRGELLYHDDIKMAYNFIDKSEGCLFNCEVAQ